MLVASVKETSNFSTVHDLGLVLRVRWLLLCSALNMVWLPGAAIGAPSTHARPPAA